VEGKRDGSLAAVVIDAVVGLAFVETYAGWLSAGEEPAVREAFTTQVVNGGSVTFKKAVQAARATVAPPKPNPPTVAYFGGRVTPRARRNGVVQSTGLTSCQVPVALRRSGSGSCATVRRR
jgi:hypothetical protein